MNKQLDDNHIHEGHRTRMRAKLRAHGQKIFDTYELLEMLLYYVIPYKDTNPISKRLLFSFGGLDGVFSASRGELLSINGIGERAADFLLLVGRLSSVIGAEIVPESSQKFSNYEEVGNFLVKYFKNLKNNKTTGIFLNNNMQLIEVKDLYDLDFSSGGVRSKPFIDTAIKTHASVVITAHNHPHGPLFPSVGDRETNNSISASLGALGIFHAEHYLVCGDSYMGIVSTGNFISKLGQSSEVSEFIEGKRRLLEEIGECDDRSQSILTERPYNQRDFDYFVSLVKILPLKSAEDVAQRLMAKYQTIENVFTAAYDDLASATSAEVATFMKILAYVTSRRETEKFAFGKAHSKAAISDYLKALYLGQSVEVVYLIAFDAEGRVLCCELLGEGTINSSEVMPRKAVEIAIANEAKTVAIAHNHPSGEPTPSKDDLRFTDSFSSLFPACGIGFSGHYIVAGQLCNIIASEQI